MPDQLTIDDKATVGKLAHELLRERHPDWSVDGLLCHPRQAQNLCIEVRKKLCRAGLKDHDVLGALIAARKRGLIPASQRTRKARVR